MGHEGLKECAIAVIVVNDANVVGHFVCILRKLRRFAKVRIITS